MRKTTIIIPTYNEKENIGALIADIFKNAPDVRVLIVDDGSPDGTGRIAERISKEDDRVSVLHKTVRRERSIDGLKEALKNQKTRYIMEMDADFTHDPAYIPDFLEEIKHNDIVIGSRFVRGGSDAARRLKRRCFSRVVNYFIRKHLGLNVKDCTSGYRCFKRRVLDSINLDCLISRGPAVLEEILYIAFFKHYRIKEIPVVLQERKKGTSKLGFRKLCGVFKDILIFKITHMPEEKKKKDRGLRKFGFSLGLGLNIAGCIMFYRGKPHFIWFMYSGSLSLIFAILCPSLLNLIKKILDFVISMIGRLTNVISLTLVFYLIFTPIGILLRFFGKDTLDKNINRVSGSYWIKRQKCSYASRSHERMG